MIIYRSIFGKLNRLTLSDRELLQASFDTFNPDTCPCPSCGAKGFLVEIESYTRHMISEACCDESSYVEVSIPRYACGSCGHSHALLGDVLTPHSSFSLTFVLKALYGYLTRTGRVDDYCASIGISVTTLYNWIHVFISHYNSWCKALDRIASSLCTSAIDIVCSFEDFLPDFMSRFGFPFLSRKTKHSHPPSSPPNSSGGSTA